MRIILDVRWVQGLPSACRPLELHHNGQKAHCGHVIHVTEHTRAISEATRSKHSYVQLPCVDWKCKNESFHLFEIVDIYIYLFIN